MTSQGWGKIYDSNWVATSIQTSSNDGMENQDQDALLRKYRVTADGSFGSVDAGDVDDTFATGTLTTLLLRRYTLLIIIIQLQNRP